MSWISWALLSAVFAALTAIFAKMGVARIDSDLATLVRTALILLLLGPFVFITGKWSNPLSLPPRDVSFLALSAVATGASWICYFRALQLGPVAQVASLDKLSVVLVAIFAIVFLSDRPSALGWLGIVLVSAGAAVIAFAASRGTA